MASRSKEPNLVKLMLDSGVFSAWNRGGTLKLKDYINYLREHEELLWSYVGMDVIPGTFGRKRTSDEVEKSASGTYKNQQKMKDAGLSPIPVYHQGEDWKWLEAYLKDGEPYIGISSAKDIWVKGQANWLDEVFSILTDSKGRPIVKTHGFGLTRPAFSFRYPWYTVDSTTWSLSAGFGKVFCPVYEGYTRVKHEDGSYTLVGGKPNYLRRPINIITSGIEQKSSTTQRNQFDQMGPIHEAMVERFLREEVGINVAQARYGTTSRRRAILTYYMRQAESVKGVRFTERHSHFGENIKMDLSDRKGHPPWNLTLMFATSLSKEWADLMNSVGAYTRLLSYYELQDKPYEVLHEYVKKGILGTYTKKAPATKWTSEAYRNYRRLRIAERMEAYSEQERTTGQADDNQPRA